MTVITNYSFSTLAIGLTLDYTTAIRFLELYIEKSANNVLVLFKFYSRLEG